MNFNDIFRGAHSTRLSETDNLSAMTASHQNSEPVMEPVTPSVTASESSSRSASSEGLTTPLHGILKKPSQVPLDENYQAVSPCNGSGTTLTDRGKSHSINSPFPARRDKGSEGQVGQTAADGSASEKALSARFVVGTDCGSGIICSESAGGKHANLVDVPLNDAGEGVSSSRPESTSWIFWKGKKNIPRSHTVENLKKEVHLDDHLITLEELFTRFDVDPAKGLSAEEAKKRLALDGKNSLTPPKQTPEILKFLHELVGGFSPLLFAGSLLCFVAYIIQYANLGRSAPPDNLYLAVVLFAVVIITGAFLYAQKAKSERIMESFKHMLPEHANVIRDGEEESILAEDVVLGDIVVINGGDRIPADIRILEAKALKVDNSSLTGEPEPQKRTTDAVDNPLESKNLCFYTTNAVEGWGKGIVVLRGDSSVMGRIAKLTLRIDTEETSIAKEIRAFVILISILAVIMGTLSCVIPLSLGYNALTTIILAIGLIVANVPEGIVIAVTVMLTLSAQRMAKKNCLIKNLESVETLGSCSIICTDKTGTLTQNRMTVSHLWVDNTFVSTDTCNEDVVGVDLPDTAAVHDIVRIATLCNRAHFRDEEESGPVYLRQTVGDASESALLKFVEVLHRRAGDPSVGHHPVAEIPFNSVTKMQVSVHEVEGSSEKDKGYLLVMKGAPERVWARCTTVATKDGEQMKDAAWQERFEDAYNKLGGAGERVLGFCDFILPPEQFPYPTMFDPENPNIPLEGLRFVGLMSLMDPPRAAVPDAVAKCRSAGIRLIMVTGDHPVTAKAIAKAVGIISESSETVEDIAERLGIEVEDVDPSEARAMVIHGERLRSMTASELDSVLRNYPEIVFARTSPQQKLIIVEACQRLGATVAVTGDGFNDSPALKKANIGIAMGITGSDVSKQAADMVLLDDNFASIVTGIEEGRLIFDNLKKTICYSIMSNIPEIAPILLYFILSIPLGLSTIPMLLLCLVTDMIPAISMAHESAEGDIMTLPSRPNHDRLVNARLIHCAYLQAGVICSVGAFFTYFIVFAECGFLPWDLIRIRAQWENRALDDLHDSYGQEWTYAQRMVLQRVVNSAFFVSVVVFQWTDIIMRKMRRKSIVQKGMGNWFLNFAVLCETAFAAFVVYTPRLNSALNLHSIPFVWWLPVIPFGVCFLFFDEVRRYWIRHHPHGWFEKEFYF